MKSETPTTDAFEESNFQSGEEEFTGRGIDKCLDFARRLETALRRITQISEEKPMADSRLAEINSICEEALK